MTWMLVAQITILALVGTIVLSFVATLITSHRMSTEPEEITFDEGTLLKVYNALLNEDIPMEKSINVVNSILNQGVLFRERV